jgi:hypothetical protein
MSDQNSDQEKRGPGRPRKEADTDTAPNSRRERVPLNAMRQKLQAPGRKGFVRRYVNDVGGRLQDFQQAGYQFVEDPEIYTDGTGSRVSRRAGVQDNGKAMHAYLMEQTQENYDEDQMAKRIELDKTDDSIRNGNMAGQVGQDGRYIPSQGITLKRD